MAISTRSRTFLARAGLALVAAGALVLSPACTDSSPSDGDQQQEQQDDNGDNQQDDQDDDQDDQDDG